MSKWIMSTRRVLGGLEMLIGNVRVALIRWEDNITYVDFAGQEPFEVANTSEGMKQVHKALQFPPPEDASIGGRQ
jgi:hypothetical protein